MTGVVITASTVPMLTDGAADDSNVGLRMVCDGEMTGIIVSASKDSMLSGETADDCNVGLR